MGSGDPLAYRPGAPVEVTADRAWPVVAARALTVDRAWPIGPATPRVAAAAHPFPGARRIGAESTSAALVFHGLFAVLFLLAWHSMVRPIVTSDATPVELVSEVPGETPPPAAKPQPQPQPTPSPPPAAAAALPPPPPPAPAETPSPTPTPPTPPPPSPQQSLDKALASPLVEPPPEPKAAASQSEVNQSGHAGSETKPTDAPAKGSASAPPDPRATEEANATPTVLTTDKAATLVPEPGTATTAQKPPAQGDPAQSTAKATAQLSAALATDSIPMPLSFRAALSAHGDASDANYRGSVFGAINRARQALNQEAEAKRLKGQVIVAIVLTDTGAIAQVSIMQSSGSDAADAFALAMIRRAAPFPPPPPGASHTFMPAISFGSG